MRICLVLSQTRYTLHAVCRVYVSTENLTGNPPMCGLFAEVGILPLMQAIVTRSFSSWLTQSITLAVLKQRKQKECLSIRFVKKGAKNYVCHLLRPIRSSSASSAVVNTVQFLFYSIKFRSPNTEVSERMPRVVRKEKCLE